jgi:rhamnosyl/mannosyltransferase
VLNRWRNKVSVIPLGVRDMSASVPAKPLVPRRPFVLAVGRMAHYKGFDTLIEAARLLPPHVSVVIVGGGDLLPGLRALARSCGLEDRVHMPGRLSDEEVASLMAACDVFCMPSISRAESFGIAMVEAMAFGKPVVATNIPGSGVPWVSPSGQTGLNVPPGNAPALAEALSQLLAEPDFAQRLGLAARHRFLQEFDAQQMTDRTVALYEDLLSQRRPGRVPARRSAVGHRRVLS